MMRFQRVSPDYLPFSNGKKSNLRTTCKEDGENGKTSRSSSLGYDAPTNSEGTTKGFRFRSPSKSQDNANSPPLSENNTNNQSQRLDISPSPGDVLLQWGQKKRARLSRTEIRSLTDDSSSSSSLQGRQPINKVQRRGSGFMDKLSTVPMPPPPPPPSNGTSTSRASTLRSKETSGFITNRNLEDRSGSVNGSPSRNGASGNTTRAVSRSTATAGKGSSPSPDKIDKKTISSGSRKDEKPNGSSTRTDHNNHVDSAPVRSEQDAGGAGGGEKVNIEVIEWPKIYVALSRKEKEDDFLAMKGTKLPHRPKKRAKNIDRALQFCFPGLWLSDLSKNRYEVREKKSVKKQKRRGLKGMECMDSDSE